MKTYFSLFARHKDQDREEVFAHFPWNGSAGETWEAPFQRLAEEVAKNEDWNFRTDQFKRPGRNFPILTTYLNHTFRRLQELGLIKYTDDGAKACFNTGLQTKYEKDIYATFFRNNEAEIRKQPDWTLYTWADSYSKKLDEFRPLLGIATYVTDAADLVFDTTYDIHVNYEHILGRDENRERLPESLKDNTKLAKSAIEGAIGDLKDRIIRNYKTAIPHWYEGRTQLLLPLYLTSEDVADLALVADKVKESKMYRITTLLTMDMAYIDARLITRPDREWLNP